MLAKVPKYTFQKTCCWKASRSYTLRPHHNVNQTPTDYTYIFLQNRNKFGKKFLSCFPSLLFASYCREISESRKCFLLDEAKLKSALQIAISEQTRAISRSLCTVLGPQQLISLHRMAPVPLCSLLCVDVWKTLLACTPGSGWTANVNVSIENKVCLVWIAISINKILSK